MNVIKLYGGLGNQLFQYALGKAQMQNGIDVRFDVSWFNKPDNAYRPYCLNKFNIDLKVSPFVKQPELNEVRLKYQYNPDYVKMDGYNFYGYWQHPAYFQSVLPELKKEFTVKKQEYTQEYLVWLEMIINSDSVSLHVRRGDYIQINGHHLLTLDYYKEALHRVTGREFFVFSDDIPWCQQYFQGSAFNFVILPEYLCFELMSLCKHHIIANSTFSWWAAYLGYWKGKTVIAPDQWRLDKKGQAYVSKDILRPEGWQIISLPTDWNGK